MRISYVVEGATDYIVLDALVERFLQTDNYIPTQIQPPISAFANDLGALGCGWHGVLSWCKQEGATQEGFADSLVLANCDCLILHVDADIAHEAELAEHHFAAPCPPARPTCDNLRAHLIFLFGGTLPPKAVLCIPAQCTEAWVFAALHPDLVSQFEPLECRNEVERLLIGKRGKLVRGKGKGTHKEKARYRDNAERIAAGWENAVAYCPEALRFDAECKAVLPP